MFSILCRLSFIEVAFSLKFWGDVQSNVIKELKYD